MIQYKIETEKVYIFQLRHHDLIRLHGMLKGIFALKKSHPHIFGGNEIYTAEELNSIINQLLDQ